MVVPDASHDSRFDDTRELLSAAHSQRRPAGLGFREAFARHHTPTPLLAEEVDHAARATSRLMRINSSDGAKGLVM